MKIKEVRVLLDRVVIRPDKAPQKTGFGIVLPASARKVDKIQTGTVVQCGESVRDVAPGDRVYYYHERSQDLEHVGALGCVILREEDLCAKICKST